MGKQATFAEQREAVIYHLLDWKNPYSTGKPEDEDPMMMVENRDLSGGAWPINKEVEKRQGDDAFARSHRAVKRAAYAVAVREPHLYAAVLEAELFFNAESGDSDYRVFKRVAAKQAEEFDRKAEALKERIAKLPETIAERRKAREAREKAEGTEAHEAERKKLLVEARKRITKPKGEKRSKAKKPPDPTIRVPKAMRLLPLVELYVDSVTEEAILEMNGEEIYALYPERMLRKTDKRLAAEKGYREISPVFEALQAEHPGWSARRLEEETAKRCGHARSTVQKAVEFCRMERETKERTQT